MAASGPWEGNKCTEVSAEIAYIDDCGVYYRVFSCYKHCGVVIKHFAAMTDGYRETAMAINGS